MTSIHGLDIYLQYHSTKSATPLELLAAEYSWNTKSDGFFRDPANAAEMRGIDHWIYEPANPPRIYGPGKLFDRICAHLYGSSAAAPMSEYYRLAKWLPDVQTPEPPPDRAYYRGRKSLYLPRIWNYVTAVPSYWYHLMIDSHTWGAVPDDRYQGWLRGFELTAPEVHRRLARRWRLAAELNASGGERVKTALRARPNLDTMEDLQYLSSLVKVYQPLIESLRDYHEARSNPTALQAAALLHTALKDSRIAEALAARFFPDPVDPAMGEIRSLRTYPQQLAAAIEAWEKSK